MDITIEAKDIYHEKSRVIILYLKKTRNININNGFRY